MTRTGGSTTRSLLLCLLAVIGLVATRPLQGQSQTPKVERVGGHDAVAGEVLVKYRSTPSTNLLSQLDGQMNADRRKTVGSHGAQLVHSPTFGTASLLSFLRAQPEVEYAEPNYIRYATDTVPNDPSFPQLWGLRNTATPAASIGAAKAWDVSRGSSAIVVAVVDTGVDYTHPDLAANIWSAPTAFTVNLSGVSITCPAGSHGFNAITNSCDPMDDNNHGTHVSGTIGAVGNNGVGVVGVNWTTRIMGAKFLSAGGSGTTADAVEAIEFVLQAKQHFGALANVRVMSNSWGGGGYSQALADEVTKANTSNVLFVAAAGNSAANNDTGSFYPANYPQPNVLAVAATTSTNALASFSDYGATTVDLGAPGVGILSTTRNNTYTSFSGTSMAAPHVSGAAALGLSACNLTTAALKNDLMSTVTQIPSLTGITVTGGVLNVDAAIRACAGVGPPVPQAPSAPATISAVAGNGVVTVKWAVSNGATSYTIKRGLASQSETPLLSGVTTASYADHAVTNGKKYFYVVQALNGTLASAPSKEVSATPLAPPAAPTGFVATAGKGRVIVLKWNAVAGATSYRVRRAMAAAGPYVFLGSTTLTGGSNTGLIADTKYFYVVSAVNAIGEGKNSGPVAATAKN